MLLPINLDGLLQERVGVGFGEVRRLVILIQLRLASLDDDTFAAFVEHLRDACQQPAFVERAVEANADEAGREFGGIAQKAPWNAARLVIQSGVNIPGAGRLVLERLRERL